MDNNPPRALIVEDEALVLMDLEQTLMDLGYEIAGKASDLRRGLELARDRDIDVAVLDVNLAGANSAAIADELQRRGIPFVFTTGYTSAGIPDRHRDSMRIDKPYESSVLDRALKQVLSSPPGFRS